MGHQSEPRSAVVLIHLQPFQMSPALPELFDGTETLGVPVPRPSRMGPGKHQVIAKALPRLGPAILVQAEGPALLDEPGIA